MTTRQSTPRPPLLGGPYRAVRVRPGHTVVCLMRGEVEVHGVTEGARSTDDGPLAWPYVEPCPGTRRLTMLVLGDLPRAVRTESVQAVCHYWRVGRHTVQRWRRALGVGRMTAGTRALWAALAPTRLGRDARSRGGASASAARRARRGPPVEPAHDCA